MKKVLAYIILILSLSTLIIASSSYLTEAVSKYIPDPYRYGDLYLFSNIKKFKQRLPECEPYQYEKAKIKEVNLYLLGDSYAEHIASSDFHFNQYTFFHWDRGTQPIALDTNKKNVLVIESVERYFRDRFKATRANGIIVIDSSINQKEKPDKEPFEMEKYLQWQAEANLDYLLNNNDFILLLKEVKAAINYHVFGKFDERVSIVDGKYAFYTETTDSTLKTSSFNALLDSEVDTMVSNINKAFNHYEAMGFDEVYFAIVPNAVSINLPNYGKYNHLIERIQCHNDLHVPFINIYDSMVEKPTVDFYYISDGHWNCEGRKIFIKALYDLND